MNTERIKSAREFELESELRKSKLDLKDLKSDRSILSHAMVGIFAFVIGYCVGLGQVEATEQVDKTAIELAHKLTEVITQDIKRLENHLKYIQVRFSSLESSHHELIKECRMYE